MLLAVTVPLGVVWATRALLSASFLTRLLRILLKMSKFSSVMPN